MTDNNWQFYLIRNGRRTYAGVSTDPVRRLRQHNLELSGGAKYTTSKGPGWTHMCIVTGFDKIQALQFEWAVKHCAPRNAGGPINRVKKLINILNRDKWTSNSPDASTVPLTLTWLESYDIGDYSLPHYVNEVFETDG